MPAAAAWPKLAAVSSRCLLVSVVLLVSIAALTQAQPSGSKPADASVPAASAAAGFRLVEVGRFSRPTYLASPPGDRRRQFVVEARGTIRVIRDGKALSRPFLDIRRRVSCCGESGLLSMAFAPDYARSRRLYVYFTDRRGSIAIDEYRTSASGQDRALPRSRRTVLRQAHTTENHKGGQLAFGPDGMLYAGLGDGGPAKDPRRRGQNLRTLLGKIIRIDPRHGRRYRVPRSNPFGGRRGARKEIWAYGVRNPWRFSFTRHGSFVLGDVGQDMVEEIDYVAGRRGRPARGGFNFGWSIFEGTHRVRPGRAPGHVRPVLQHRHGPGGLCSIIGGFVVRDRALPSLRGRYVYGDFCNPELRVVSLRAGRAVGDRELGVRVKGASSFGEDAQGRLYVMSVQGPVLRLAPRR